MDKAEARLEERNEILLSLYPMVQRIAQRTAATYGLPQGVDTSDLVSCGVIGLAEAWDRFDPARGVAFEAFAVPRVKGAIVDAIRASDWVPRKARAKARLTGEPLMLLVSMDERTATDDGDRSGVGKLADESNELPGAEILEEESRRELMSALDDLPERERMIVTLHYFQGVQLAEIARSLGVTESRVSQLHTRALRMLKGSLEALESQISAA
jgi:RNA polymerase sigma factor for flagellar operon FliA